MIRKLAIIIICIMSFSCSMRKNIMINDVILEKVRIDATENPARKLFMLNDLSDKKRIILSDMLVKDITSSTNIDYDFCIIGDMQTDKGLIECYIYTRNIKKISMLEKGKTRIHVSGEFSRFFTMLDEFFTKIEIVKAAIEINK